jgi:hypothetical protein
MPTQDSKSFVGTRDGEHKRLELDLVTIDPYGLWLWNQLTSNTLMAPSMVMK